METSRDCKQRMVVDRRKKMGGEKLMDVLKRQCTTSLRGRLENTITGNPVI
jgi:hypothetical protein